MTDNTELKQLLRDSTSVMDGAGKLIESFIARLEAVVVKTSDTDLVAEDAIEDTDAELKLIIADFKREKNELSALIIQGTTKEQTNVPSNSLPDVGTQPRDPDFFEDATPAPSEPDPVTPKEANEQEQPTNSDGVQIPQGQQETNPGVSVENPSVNTPDEGPSFTKTEDNNQPSGGVPLEQSGNPTADNSPKSPLAQ